jgi:hypothetical protein
MIKKTLERPWPHPRKSFARNFRSSVTPKEKDGTVSICLTVCSTTFGFRTLFLIIQSIYVCSNTLKSEGCALVASSFGGSWMGAALFT